MAIGLVGVVLINQPDVAGGHWAVTTALVSSFTSAVALIGLHQVKELDPRAIVAHFSAVALIGCVAALFVFERNLGLNLTWQSAALLLGTGLFATIGQLFLTKAFAAGPPARVSVVGLSQVGITMLLEAAIWHRSFSALTLVGISLVIVPTIWTLLRGAPPPREVPLDKAPAHSPCDSSWH